MAKTLLRRPRLVADGGLGSRQRAQCRTAIDDALAAWLRPQGASTAATELLREGIPAAALATSLDLITNDHLIKRGFWEAHGTGVLPGLPWCASFGRTCGAAPELGADTETILNEVLDLSRNEIAALRKSGALG